MAKNNQKKTNYQPESQFNVVAGCYNRAMVDFLGYELVKNAYNASVLAIEDAQTFSNEVRTKGFQCAGLLVTLIVALITGICAISSLIAKIIMISVALVLINALRGIFNGIIYRKGNATKGNVQSFMLNTQMIEELKKVKDEKRATFFLASLLKGMENEVTRLNKQTQEAQCCFERETKTMIKLLWLDMIILSIFALIYHFYLHFF